MKPTRVNLPSRNFVLDRQQQASKLGMRAALLLGFLAMTAIDATAGELIAAYFVSSVQQSCCVRPQDQIWLISTRRMGRNANPASCSKPQLAYFQFCCANGGWVERSECQFMATNNCSVVNTVFIHGNRQRSKNVKNRGFQAYCMFKQCAPQQPIRHIIWEWPSMPIPCRAAVVRDGRVKLRRTPAQSYFLGWWLSQLPPETDVRILAYSYGTRTLLGGLHLLAGGELNGRQLPPSQHCDTVTPRIALWAAATQGDWLCPGRPHGCALNKVSGCLNFYNHQDPVLSRLEKFMVVFTGPPLGLSGINGSVPVYNINATCNVGKRHSADFYFQSARVVNCTRQFLGM